LPQRSASSSLFGLVVPTDADECDTLGHGGHVVLTGGNAETRTTSDNQLAAAAGLGYSVIILGMQYAGA
jgi:hypothetical protein